MSSLNDKIDESMIEQKYVSIKIADDVYGIPVVKVQEVLGDVEAKQVPNSQPFMKGVVNLRGKVIPLVDLRMRLGFSEKKSDIETVVLITQVFDKLLGLIVDSISDVVEINESEIQNTPHFPLKIETDCVKGIGQIENEIFILIDVDKVFTKSELENLFK